MAVSRKDACVCLDACGQSPGALGGFARRRTGSELGSSTEDDLLRVVTGQWGARIVPAGAAVPFGCACLLFQFFRLKTPLAGHEPAFHPFQPGNGPRAK